MIKQQILIGMVRLIVIFYYLLDSLVFSTNTKLTEHVNTDSRTIIVFYSVNYFIESRYTYFKNKKYTII